MFKKDQMVIKNGKALRKGFTTGSCACAAAAAAAELLLGGKTISSVEIYLPNGTNAAFDVMVKKKAESSAVCAVIKDAGDDPDITDGVEISAKVSFAPEGIHFFAGSGVGTVTCSGLPIEKGEPAINPGPRKMIQENLKNISQKYGYTGGFAITVSAKGGEELAKHTFNPRLGIEGGISILGTTGIVEPMSEQALIDTIHLTIDRARIQNSQQIIVSPGNYGRDYCLHQLGFSLEDCIKCSNFIGETLDYLVYRDFSEILLVGHIGKLVKLAGGIMNTHSSIADARMEILASHCALAGGNQQAVKSIMESRTTDQALSILDQWNLTDTVCHSLLNKIVEHIRLRTHGKISIHVIVFTTEERLLIKTEKVEDFIKRYQKEKS